MRPTKPRSSPGPSRHQAIHLHLGIAENSRLWNTGFPGFAGTTAEGHCFTSSFRARTELRGVSNSPDLALAQQLERRRVGALVAGRDDASASLRRTVLPRGHDAARASDDRNERNHIVWLELGLDHEIDVAGSQHAIGVTVAA